LGRLGKLENILNNALIPSTNASNAHSGRETPIAGRGHTNTNGTPTVSVSSLFPLVKEDNNEL